MMNLKLLALLVGVLTLGAVEAQSAQLKEIEKPTGVKVKAAFNYWENVYNENMCYPNAWAYKVVSKTDSETWEQVIKTQVAKIGEDNKNVKLKQLSSSKEVTAASIELLKSMFGSSDGAE